MSASQNSVSESSRSDSQRDNSQIYGETVVTDTQKSKFFIKFHRY